jgi:dipeptidyl aminopeptidase/acylaminoacyl peptidase
LLPDYPGHVLTAAWRDPRTICYIGEKGVGTVFEEVNKDSAGMRELLSGGPILTRLSVSQDGAKFAFAGHSPTHAAELFRADAAEKTARRISDSNPWLANRRFAPQEPVRHKARDGLELEGVLIRPLDEEKGRRYPLVLAVHGGPEAHVPNGWTTSYSIPAQVLAARGFAVFFPNYRGSTGRGVAFSKLGQGDPAGKEFDDLVDAVDHLVETGLVDKAKVGITGGSYGGYASAWGATRFSDRFAASVMFVGISDWISGYGSTDIPNEMYHVHFRKWLWEDTQLLFERSPLRHVEKARTPILILHGKDDPRVHPVQSLELYRSLKLLGKAPVRLVLYPGEGHGNRRAASRFDYSVRLLDWMEHYLKGPGGSPPAHKVDYEERLGIEGAKSAAPPAEDDQD